MKNNINKKETKKKKQDPKNKDKKEYKVSAFLKKTKVEKNIYLDIRSSWMDMIE
jgi:hypothetical protein